MSEGEMLKESQHELQKLHVETSVFKSNYMPPSPKVSSTRQMMELQELEEMSIAGYTDKELMSKRKSLGLKIDTFAHKEISSLFPVSNTCTTHTQDRHSQSTQIAHRTTQLKYHPMHVCCSD